MEMDSNIHVHRVPVKARGRGSHLLLQLALFLQRQFRQGKLIKFIITLWSCGKYVKKTTLENGLVQGFESTDGTSGFLIKYVAKSLCGLFSRVDWKMYLKRRRKSVKILQRNSEVIKQEMF